MKIKNFLKKKLTKKNIINKLAAVSSMSMALLTPVFAAGDAMTTAKSLLSKGVGIGGGLWAIWGIVQLGISIKDSDGPGMGKAIWQIVGGAIVVAAGVAIGNLDMTLTV